MKTETGRFRQKKTSFTATSNKVLFDTNLDMDTKTLHNMITYYISIPDFTLYKAHLQKQSGAGQRAFNRMWKQLKDNGYLVQYKFKDEKGTFYYEYELFDEPQEPQVQNVYVEKEQEKNPEVHYAHMGDAGMDNAVDGYCSPINKTIDNKTLNNKIISNKKQQQEHKEPIVVVKEYHAEVISYKTNKLDKEVQEVYVRAFGKLPNVMVQEQLRAYLNMFEKDVVIMALEKAGVKQKGVDYAYGILKNWFNADAKTFDAVFKHEEQYQ
ncbi:MAG: DnaD domain protein [Clostridiales bacterium]|nr:DnaD domain protein [Clostridiales bacterium]